MPSVWDVLGETLAETAPGPLVVGGAIVSIVAVPDGAAPPPAVRAPDATEGGDGRAARPNHVWALGRGG